MKKMTVEEVINQYKNDAQVLMERIETVRSQMKADHNKAHMVMYRKRIETLYEEHSDMMSVIEQLMPYLQRERELANVSANVGGEAS